MCDYHSHARALHHICLDATFKHLPFMFDIEAEHKSLSGAPKKPDP